MEKGGIGTDATIAAHIALMYTRGYAERMDNLQARDSAHAAARPPARACCACAATRGGRAAALGACRLQTKPAEVVPLAATLLFVLRAAPSLSSVPPCLSRVSCVGACLVAAV